MRMAATAKEATPEAAPLRHAIDPGYGIIETVFALGCDAKNSSSPPNAMVSTSIIVLATGTTSISTQLMTPVSPRPPIVAAKSPV